MLCHPASGFPIYTKRENPIVNELLQTHDVNMVFSKELQDRIPPKWTTSVRYEIICRGVHRRGTKETDEEDEEEPFRVKQVFIHTRQRGRSGMAPWRMRPMRWPKMNTTRQQRNGIVLRMTRAGDVYYRSGRGVVPGRVS